MVRTKQTGKARPKTNGTAAKSPPPDAAATAADKTAARSSAQPAELSQSDRAKLKTWLDRSHNPFGIAIAAPTASLKRKRDSAMQLQTDLWEERLNVRYEVRPRDKWDCLRRYKKFTVGSESIAVGQCILVKHDDSEDAKIDIAAQWKAKVLEVRALDSEHVYIRVAWLNRPEDLDSGRKPYHGKNELIPTNQMDVIDAMAVNGSLEVAHWDEQDDEGALMNEEEFFWRQTLDHANTKTFSKLREICIDSAPQNPDEMILQCGNKDCRKWLHVKCIAETAVQHAVDELPDAKRLATSEDRDDVMINARSLALAKAQSDSVAAEVMVKGLPDSEGQAPAENTRIVITDSNGKRRTQAVACLFCGQEIE